VVDAETKKKFLEFLKNNNVAVISTVSPDNQPMSAIIYYIVDDNFNFYFMSKNTRKVQNIEMNNKVALQIGNGNAPVGAQIHGEAGKIIGDAEFDEKRDQLIQSLLHNKFSPPIFEIEGEEFVIYNIKPTWMRWLDLRGKTENKGFKEILP